MPPPWDLNPGAMLLFDVWRHVSEHLDIASCIDGLSQRLRQDLPIHRIWVRRLDLANGWLETVAVAPWQEDLSSVPSRTSLDAAELRWILPWLRMQVLEAPPPRLRRLVVPDDDGRPWVLAGGLVDEGAPVGMVVIESDADVSHMFLGELLAPIVVALRNDARLHEVARLRETVEADNRALLSRLARVGLTVAVVGADAGLRHVMAQVHQVSQTDAPVLILGETGSGKEVVAREIHARSRRRRGPFLKVNCGAIPAELVDSELFGHEKGSFTGAIADRRGWFERADGGTLFLDEIGELPAAAQVRLLRVLQDGSFERVGGQRPMNADVRIVAATHRDLREMVREGSFREDLWYRIGVFPLQLPPLRDRMDDLPALAAHFAASAGERLHGRPMSPTVHDVELLRAYRWPGNVRELGAVIERAVILGDGHRLDIRAALGVQVDAAPQSRSRGEGTVQTPPRGGPSGGTLEDVNRGAIEAALAACRGRIEGRRGAALRLGLSPSTLRSRMKKLGIVWHSYREE
jgi:hydrogenase-4 transcriptional activator